MYFIIIVIMMFSVFVRAICKPGTSTGHAHGFPRMFLLLRLFSLPEVLGGIYVSELRLS